MPKRTRTVENFFFGVTMVTVNIERDQIEKNRQVKAPRLRHLSMCQGMGPSFCVWEGSSFLMPLCPIISKSLEEGDLKSVLWSGQRSLSPSFLLFSFPLNREEERDYLCFFENSWERQEWTVSNVVSSNLSSFWCPSSFLFLPSLSFFLHSSLLSPYAPYVLVLSLLFSRTKTSERRFFHTKMLGPA